MSSRQSDLFTRRELFRQPGGAMASGIATLTTLKESNPYPRLELLDSDIGSLDFRNLATKAGIPHSIPRVGSMFTFFFNPENVTSLTVAMKSDTKSFARYFHAMLERGVYLACSQFEANFVSPHTPTKTSKQRCKRRKSP